jgi:lipoate-protein ligase B
VSWLGTVPYAEALALQEEAVAARRAGRAPDRLLLLEHPPVVTLGRGAAPAHLLASPAELAARGVEVHRVARGGGVTWHGPGQLVGYPIVDLRALGRPDAHAWLRALEAALIDAAGALGVAAGRRPGLTGVFVGNGPLPRKLASIGVGLRGWVSWHGFALNVTADLAGFRDLVPCGLHGVEMTSLALELGAGAMPDLPRRSRDAVARGFERALHDLARPAAGAYTARACRAG